MRLDIETPKTHHEMMLILSVLSIRELGSCPLCGSDQIESRYTDTADLNGYCLSCKEHFEAKSEAYREYETALIERSDATPAELVAALKAKQEKLQGRLHRANQYDL